MKRFFVCLAIMPFLAGAASAGQPLTDRQMDRVTAGSGPNSSRSATPSVYSPSISEIVVTKKMDNASTKFW